MNQISISGMTKEELSLIKEQYMKRQEGKEAGESTRFQERCEYFSSKSRGVSIWEEVGGFREAM